MRDEAKSNEETELFAFTARNALLRALTSFEGVSPKEFREIDLVSGTPAEMARAVAADELVISTFTCRAPNCYIKLSRVLSKDGGVAWSDQFEVPLQDPVSTTRAITTRLRQGYKERNLRPGALELTVSREDYASYLQIQRTYGVEPETAALPVELLDQLAAIRQRSKRFLDAYLLEARVAARRHIETRDEALLDRAFELLESAGNLAPGEPEVFLARSYVETLVGRLDAATATLDILEELLPGDVRVLESRARILDKSGEMAEALTLYRTVIERRPSWKFLYYYASLAYRQGEIAVAQESLERVLALSPGNHLGISLLAQLELINGDPVRSIELYRELAKEFVSPVELSNLGLAHFLVSEYDDAAHAFEQAAELAPTHPVVIFNLADARWLQGRLEQAEDLYRQVVEMLDTHPGANDWQSLTVRAQALAHLDQPREAVAAIQEALRLSPENGQVAFEAALVYTLVGDLNTAFFNAERALELGYQVRWFRLPWFDNLRSHPEFSQLIGATENL